MNLQLLGANHKSAPVEVRERLAIPEWRLEEAMRRLMEYQGVAECVVFSTCNRVEFAVCSESGTDLRGFIREYLLTEASDLRDHLYEYRGDEVVRHLFRVAASLDSMVVGEPQILGQVKHAYTIGKAVGSIRGNLDALFTRAFTVAKRIRTETAIGSSAVSVASVAVELAKKIFGSLQGRTVLVVGAGKMSELAARHLRVHGAGTVFVSNRTHDRAQRMADTVGGTAVDFEDIYDTADRADIVITSTGAPHSIFRREHGEQFMQRRKNRPMFFIDIAVPRDVDAAMSQVDGVFVYDIDDLQQVVDANVSDRGREAQRAEMLIEEEVARFQRRILSLDAVPTIVALQGHVEHIRQGELNRLRSKLSGLSPEQLSAVDNLTRSLVNKILHGPLSTLKSVSGSDQLTATADLLRSLFNLEDESVRRNGTSHPALPREENDARVSQLEASEDDVMTQKSGVRR